MRTLKPLARAVATIDAKDARIAELTRELDENRALADRLKLEAQIHAGEARTANSTIYEIYQVLSGSTGEPGNWNGAEPARKFVAEVTDVLRGLVVARLKPDLDRARALITRLTSTSSPGETE